jgi:acyl-CoA synthetase (AMP-forming)/AMP-acid ligase II
MTSEESGNRYPYASHKAATLLVDMAASEHVNLLTRFDHWRKTQPDKSAFIFLISEKEVPLTYGELWLLAEQAAVYYRENLQLSEQPLALLLYPWSPEFIISLLACQMANIIPVPSSIPLRRDQSKRMDAIISDSGAEIILTSESAYETISNVSNNYSVPILVTDWMRDQPFIISSEQPKYTYKDITSRDPVAFIQYTSGSTGNPKGVVVTESNLTANLSLIEKAFNLSEETVHVSWLPFFHDMGLVGSIFGTLWCGGTAVMMSPESFVLRPWKWLQAISDYRANVSGGPNFAYDLCVKRVQAGHLDDLDLSSWKVAFNGAEPVKKATLDKFSKMFAKVNFSRESFTPCYGLAEATLMVSSSVVGVAPVVAHLDADALESNIFLPSGEENLIRVRDVVSSGRVKDDSIVIVDPVQKVILPDKMIGEIWIQSESVAAGYWNRSEARNEDFYCRLDSSDTPYLRTGDMGVVSEGEIYVIGRSGEVIIQHGRNIYPSDVEELILTSVSYVDSRATAAIQLHADNDRVVVVHEISKSLSNTEFVNIACNIKNIASRDLGLHLDEVILVPLGAIPKTTSGKIQRNKLAQNIISNNCEILYRFRSLHRSGHDGRAAN